MIPKISIITICYNEQRVEDTCKSIVAQTFKDYEWIFIDGGSSENYLKIFDKYKSHMSTFISEKDSGIYNAMNKGLKFVTGEFVVFMNAGDRFYNDTILEKVSKYLDKNIGDIFYGDAAFILQDNSTKYKCLPPVIDETFLTHDCISHQSAYIKKELFDKYGRYNENYRIVSDWEKWIEFLKNGAKYIQLPFTASIHHYDGVSATAYEKVKIEREDVCKRYNLNTSSKYYGVPLFDVEGALNPKIINTNYEIFSNNKSLEIPDFSIIIPIFNTSKYLERCLDSIFNQPFKNIEVICINDASTDSSLEVLKTYQQKEPRLSIYNCKENVGVANCRNLGIEVAKGDYIVFVDSDDYVNENFFTNSYNEIKKATFDVLKGTMHLVNGKSITFSTINSKIKKLMEQNKFIGMDWQHEFWTGVYNRNFLLNNNIHFPLLTNGEDIIFILKVLSADPQIKICDDIIYYYYQRANSASLSQKYQAGLNVIAHFYEQIDIIKSMNLPKEEFLEYCQNNIIAKVIDYWWVKVCLKNFSKAELKLLKQKINQVFSKMECLELLIAKYQQYYFLNNKLFQDLLLSENLKLKIADIANNLEEIDFKLFNLLPFCKIKKNDYIYTIKVFGFTLFEKKQVKKNVKKYYLCNIPFFKQYQKNSNKTNFYFLGIYFLTIGEKPKNV